MSRGRTVLRLDLTQAVLEEPAADLLTALQTRKRPLFADLLRAIRHAAADPAVAGVVARVGGPTPVFDLAHAQELRAALRTVRDAGKPALGFAETFGEFGPGTVAYLAATAFSQLWLQPSGDLGLTGFALQTVFAREALDKLGIQARIGQRQEYKNAPDTLLSTGYSDAHREALTAVAQSLLTQVVDAVAADRGITAAAVRELVDRAPLTPAAALAAGLLDRVGYRDEFARAVRETFGGGPAGEPARMLGAAQLLAKADRSPAELRRRLLSRSPAHPGIALVSVVGGIRTGRSGRSALQGSSVGSDTVCAALRSAGRDPAIAGVVLRVDSPGGSYLASDTIRREVLALRRAGKPVVASMGAYAASGGYFVSMAADHIVAQPGTLTGSIGVFGGKIVTRELAERYGVRRDAVTAGGHSRLFSAALDYSEDEWELMSGWLDRVYDDFTAKAAADRGLPVERLRDIARGRVWVGTAARDLGLVDSLGGLETARLAASGLTGLDPERARLVRIPATDLPSRLRAAAGGGPQVPVRAAGVSGGWAAAVGELVGASAAGDLRAGVDALALLAAGPAGALRMTERLLA